MNSDLRARLQEAMGKDYDVGFELGGGVQSRVFVARDNELDRKVVIKVLPPELAAGDGIERFRREIKLVAGLQHPHIVPLLIAGETDDLLFYTMPFVVGDSLRARIERDGPQETDFVANVLAEISSALAYAHGRGIVHRDVKPENIFIEAESGRALLADFGVARRIGFEGAVTGGGVAVGTPAYMSPEHIDGGAVDGRSDLYSLGLVGWELLAGQRPWHGETLYALIFNQKYEPAPPLDERRADVPPRLRHAIERALEKDPDARFEHAEAMLTYLCDENAELPRLVRRRASVAGSPGVVQPTDPPRRAPTPRTITAGKLEVRWVGDPPFVMPRRLVEAKRAIVPAAVLACALLLAIGLKWAGSSTRVAAAETRIETAVAPVRAPDDYVTLPAVSARTAAPGPVTPAVVHTATNRLDRVFALLVGAFGRSDASAARELRRAQDTWESGRRRTCGRLDGRTARTRCLDRLAVLRTEELSELLARAR